MFFLRLLPVKEEEDTSARPICLSTHRFMCLFFCSVDLDESSRLQMGQGRNDGGSMGVGNDDDVEGKDVEEEEEEEDEVLPFP